MTEILTQEIINKKIDFIINKGKKPKKVQNKSDYEKDYFQKFTKIELVVVKFAMQILNIIHL